MEQARVLYSYDADQDDELTLEVGQIIEKVDVQDGGWWEGEVNGKRGVFPENFVELIKKDGDSDKKNLPLPNRKGVKARVTFDYDAEQEDELSLKVGDIVDIHDQEEEGWWEGSLNGKRGVFPSNFVAVISDDEVGGSRTSSLGSKSEIKNIKKDPAPPPQEEDSPNETIESAAEKPKKPMGGPMGFGFALNPADLQKKLKKVDPDQKKPTQKGKKAEPVVNGMGTPMKRNAPPPPKETVKEEPKKTSSEKYIVMFQYDAINDDELNLRVGDIVMVTNKAVCEGWWEGQLRGKTGVFPDNFVQPVPSEESTTKDKPLPKKPMLPPGKGKDIDKPLPVPPSKDSKPQMPSMTQKPPLTEAKKPSLPEGKKPPPPAAKKPAPPQPPRPSKEPKKTSEVNEFPRTSSISRKGPPPQPPKSTETPLPQAPKVAVTAPEKESVNGIPNGDTAFDLDVVRPSEPLQHVNKNRIKGPAKNLPARYSQMIVDEEDSVQEPVPVKKDEPPPPAKSDAAPPWMKEVKRMSVKRSQSPTRVKKYSSQEDLTNKEAKPPAPSPVSVPSSSTSDNKEREKQQDKEVAIVKKEASSAAAAAEAANKAADNLKKDITDLQDKMADMEKRFMKHIKVLTDDLDNERKERANLQIEIDRLKKKVEILEGH